MRYKVFNPSASAESPDACYGTWETPGGSRDKHMFCQSINPDEEEEEETTTGECLVSELWIKATSRKVQRKAVQRSATWRSQKSGLSSFNEDEEWEREWAEQ